MINKLQLRIGSMWFSPDDKFLAYRATPMNATKKVKHIYANTNKKLIR